MQFFVLDAVAKSVFVIYFLYCKDISTIRFEKRLIQEFYGRRRKIGYFYCKRREWHLGKNQSYQQMGDWSDDTDCVGCWRICTATIWHFWCVKKGSARRNYCRTSVAR